MKYLIFISCCIISYSKSVAEEIERNIAVKGYVKSLPTNENSIVRIESEISEMGSNQFTMHYGFLDFKDPKIKILGGELGEQFKQPISEVKRIAFECVARTSDRMFTKKELILTSYICLRLNGMSQFNAHRVISEMAKKKESLLPEETVKIPFELLESIERIPTWIEKYYTNNKCVVGGSDPLSKKYYQIRDGDIIWLFKGRSRDELECICGYDSKHVNLSGFQMIFEKMVEGGERNFPLNSFHSERIKIKLQNEFNLHWFSPLEIPLPFD